MRARATQIAFGPAPKYVATFTGSAQRIHRRGHIWLNNEATALTIPFEVQAPFQFVSNAAGDGTAAMFVGKDPNNLTKFDDCNGVFSTPTLENGNTLLTFGVLTFDSQKYYYLFNILDTSKNRVFQVADPIIVNK